MSKHYLDDLYISGRSEVAGWCRLRRSRPPQQPDQQTAIAAHCRRARHSTSRHSRKRPKVLLDPQNPKAAWVLLTP